MNTFRATFFIAVMVALVVIVFYRWIIVPMRALQQEQMREQQVERDIAACYAQGWAWADSECRLLRERK